MIELDNGMEDYLSATQRASGPAVANPTPDDRRLRLERLAAEIMVDLTIKKEGF